MTQDNANLITVTDCTDCPFYSDDSDYGPACYHGVNIDYRLKKDDEIHIRHGVGGCVHSSLPKKCPLLINSFKIELSDAYEVHKKHTSK